MRRAGKPIANRSKHALSWQQYALLQQGRRDEARDTMIMMRDDLAEVSSGGNLAHNVLMRAAFVAEDPVADPILEPQDISDFPLDMHGLDAFASGYHYIATGDMESAKFELKSLQEKIAAAKVLSVAEGLHEDDSATSEDAYNIATIFARELQALIYFREGDKETALQLLADAAEDENSRPMEYGPPYIAKPCSELMGEMLLTLDRPGEAIAHFEQALERNTARTLSLLGLARAQQAVGDPAAKETWQNLDNAWQGDLTALKNTEYTWL